MSARSLLDQHCSRYNPLDYQWPPVPGYSQCPPYPQFHGFSPVVDEIPIFSVPFVIDCPGKYKVSKGLCYTGNGVAIIVRASNVDLNFHTHNLVLTDATATGILITDAEEVTIRHDKIRLILSQAKSQGQPIPTSHKNATCIPLPEEPGQCAGIHIRNSTKVDILDCFIEGTGYGIFAQGTSDLRLVRLLAKNNFKNNVALEDTCGSRLEDSKLTNDTASIASSPLDFDGLSVRATVTGKSRLLHVSRTNFYNSPIFLRNVMGATIDHINALLDDAGYPLAMFQTGSRTGGVPSVAENITVRESIIQIRIPTATEQNVQGVLLFAGSKNVWFDRCTVGASVMGDNPSTSGILSAFTLQGDVSGSGIKNSNIQSQGESPENEFSGSVLFGSFMGISPTNNEILECNIHAGAGSNYLGNVTAANQLTLVGNTCSTASGVPVGWLMGVCNGAQLEKNCVVGPDVCLVWSRNSSFNDHRDSTLRFRVAPVRDEGLSNTSSGSQAQLSLETPPLGKVDASAIKEFTKNPTVDLGLLVG